MGKTAEKGIGVNFMYIKKNIFKNVTFTMILCSMYVKLKTDHVKIGPKKNEKS